MYGGREHAAAVPSADPHFLKVGAENFPSAIEERNAVGLHFA